MSDCCNTSSPSKKHICPVNGQSYSQVSTRTVKHHIAEPWNYDLSTTNYYFCSAPDCDVVYFGLDDSIIKASQLRTKVGTKTNDQDALICYCFGVTRLQAEENPNIKTYVMEQTKNHICSCETSNPSGKCCLKDFN